MLVINSDNTYMHAYSKGSSGKDLIQSGTWTTDGRSIGFAKFEAWDQFGPLPDGVQLPSPAGTSFPIRQNLNGNYEIDANSDRGETFVQIERD